MLLLICLEECRIYFVDLIKQSALTIVLGGPVMYLLLYVIEIGGKNFYFYVFSLLVVLTLVFMYIFPNYI